MPNPLGSTPPGISGNGIFNSTTGVYNAIKSNMAPLKAAQAAAGSTLFRVACCGDSTTAGSLAGTTGAAQGSYPTHLRSLLATAGYTVGTGAPAAPLASGSPSDSRWTFTGSWNVAVSNGTLYYTTTDGGTATFVSDVAGTFLKIYYFDQNGTWEYQIDGGAQVPVTPGSTFALKQITVSGLANTTHTVVITGTTVSGAQAAIFAVEVGSSAGVDISAFGAPGFTAGQYATQGGATQNWLSTVKTYMGFSPAITTILDLGLNDANSGVTIPTYLTTMGTLITNLQTAGSHVILMIPMSPALPGQDGTNLPAATWLSFRQAMYTLSDQFGIPLLDLSFLYGTWSHNNSGGYMADGFHPNSAGYLLMAQALMNGIFTPLYFPAIFTPPIYPLVIPRYLEHSTPIQKRYYRYTRPQDVGVNVFILSDGTVVADYPVTLSDASLASTNIPYPQDLAGSPLIGPPEGAEGGPYGTPPPYSIVQNYESATVPLHQEFTLNPYVKYLFLGSHGPYPNISANLVAVLTAAKFDNYIT